MLTLILSGRCCAYVVLRPTKTLSVRTEPRYPNLNRWLHAALKSEGAKTSPAPRDPPGRGITNMAKIAVGKNERDFDPDIFLATIGEGRKIAAVLKKQTIYTQGDRADSVFYVQKGKVRLTVVSKSGKEATIGIVSERNFFGEGALAGQLVRMGSAAAMTDCELLRVDKKTMMGALHREHAFSDMFVAYLLARNIRYEEDLVDQLFNSSEKVKRGSLGFCCCLLISARRVFLKPLSPRSVRKLWPR